MGTLIIILIVFAVEMIILSFVPKKYLPPPKPRRRKRRYNDEYWTGLPWMGGCKEKEEKLLGRLKLNALV